MTKMKKLTSVLLAAAMAASLMVPAWAEEPTEAFANYTVNEYDYIMGLQMTSAEQLAEENLSTEDVRRITNDFHMALKERATLSDKELRDFGYNQKEIALLKAYEQGIALTDTEYRAVTGTCTASFSLASHTPKDAIFTYTWNWDHAPLMTFNDSAAVKWMAYDSTSQNIDVNRDSISSTVYDYNGTYRYGEESAKRQVNLDDNAACFQFPVVKTYIRNNQTIQAYARTGYIDVSISVDPLSSAEMLYLKVKGLYAHSTISISSPSLAISVPPSLSISFSAAGVIEKTGAAENKYYM